MASWFDVWCVLGPTRSILAKWRRGFGDDLAGWCASDAARAQWEKAGCRGERTLSNIATQAATLRRRTDELAGVDVRYLPFAALPAVWQGVVSSPYLCVAGALPEPGVAIVGTRSITAENEPRITALLKGWLSETQLSVSSGGATGVDTVAHTLAMSLRRPVVVVLAGGLLKASPAANRQDFWEIARHGGAVVTEKPPGYAQRRHDFLRRNRLIASSARSLLVVRSDPKGGAMNTARHARELGRPVGVVPGPPWAPNTVGTNSLLNLGARACYDTPSFLQLLNEGEAEFRQGGLWDWAAVCDQAESRAGDAMYLPAGLGSFVQQERGGADEDEDADSGGNTSAARQRSEVAAPRVAPGSVEAEIVRVLSGGTATTEALTRELSVEIAELQRTLLMMVLDGVVIDGVDGYRLPPLQR